MMKETTVESKIWIVSELFYPENTSTGYIITEIAKHLSKKCNVNVISGPLSYSNSQDTSDQPEDQLDNIIIFRLKSSGYNKNKIISRILGQVYISLSILKLMKKNIKDGSNILMVTNPILLLFLCSFFSLRKKWNIYLLVHDIFPDNLIPSGIFNQKGLIYKAINYLFKRSYIQAKKMIVIGRDMKKIMQKKYPSVPIELITNWSDNETITNHNIQISKHINNDATNISFLFAGNLGRVQGIEILMLALKDLKAISFEFNFIGGGVMANFIVDQIVKNNLKNVSISKSRPREEQNTFLNKCDIGVISLCKGMYGIGVPSKFYNLLAAGKAILYIGDDDTEIKLVIDQYKNGWFAKSGDVAHIKQIIMQICKTNRSEIVAMGAISRYLAENNYSKSIILSKFDPIFK